MRNYKVSRILPKKEILFKGSLLIFAGPKGERQGHLARKSFARKFFILNSWSPGAGFFLNKTINS